jgi:DNA-directed RNA polymerase subunit RPC12/RpoP
MKMKKRKIDISIEEFFEQVKLKPTKWIIRPDFMDDVINICPTCGKEFSMPDGTSVAHYYKYCPFCGDKMEE